MKLFLIALICSGRFCSFEPLYVIKYPTEAACIEAKKNQSTSDPNKRFECVPEIKLNQ